MPPQPKFDEKNNRVFGVLRFLKNEIQFPPREFGRLAGKLGARSVFFIRKFFIRKKTVLAGSTRFYKIHTKFTSSSHKHVRQMHGGGASLHILRLFIFSIDC